MTTIAKFSAEIIAIALASTMILMPAVQQAMALVTMTGFATPTYGGHGGFFNVKITGLSGPANLTNTNVTLDNDRGQLNITGQLKNGIDNPVPAKINLTRGQTQASWSGSANLQNATMTFGGDDSSLQIGNEQVYGLIAMLRIPNKDNVAVLKITIPQGTDLIHGMISDSASGLN